MSSFQGAWSERRAAVSGAPKRLYFNEFNIRMGHLCYLPIVSGLLRAYAETSEAVKRGYRFMPFIYHIDSLPNVLAQYTEPPDVAAFSLSMWNERLNLKVAAEVKRRWPHCLVVFGGCQVPHDPREYMAEHPFIDVTVRGEGEEPFLDILNRYLEQDRFADIPGVTFRERDGSVQMNAGERTFVRSLDNYPSPYLEGLYDELMASRGPERDFQAIIETNRGCPFLCTFCFWGRGGLTRKYRYHDMDRVFAEVDWCGRNGIRYVFNADSNFGMHPRDKEIAEFIVETKKKHGFPEKFRTCYGKNTDEKIFEVGLLFHKHGLEKGITLARQSNDDRTLKNIKRANIKMSTYRNLMVRFNDESIPIYTELILGLPGETVESWKRGIDDILESGLRNQLFSYLCQVLPNTEMADPEYRKRFGIRTRLIELNEIHGSVRDSSWVTEYEEIVIGTDSLSLEDWRRLAVFSWVTMLLHSMKLGFFILVYLLDRYGVKPSDLIGYVSDGQMPEGPVSMFGAELAEYHGLVDRMLGEGAGRGIVLPQYGNIYWDVEEASFLRISRELDRFYSEFHRLLEVFLKERGVDYDAAELADVVRYQRARMPAPHASPTEYRFGLDLPQYFDVRFSSAPVPLAGVPQEMRLQPVDFAGDLERFARETILWGRKSGTMLVKVAYQPRAVPIAANL